MTTILTQQGTVPVWNGLSMKQFTGKFDISARSDYLSLENAFVDFIKSQGLRHYRTSSSEPTINSYVQGSASFQFFTDGFMSMFAGSHRSQPQWLKKRAYGFLLHYMMIQDAETSIMRVIVHRHKLSWHDDYAIHTAWQAVEYVNNVLPGVAVSDLTNGDEHLRRLSHPSNILR